MDTSCLLDLTVISEADVRKEFAEEKERRLVEGEEPMHETAPSGFVFLGIELEELQ